MPCYQLQNRYVNTSENNCKGRGWRLAEIDLHGPVASLLNFNYLARAEHGSTSSRCKESATYLDNITPHEHRVGDKLLAWQLVPSDCLQRAQDPYAVSPATDFSIYHIVIP